MITATIPHHAGHRLKTVIDALSESWTYLKAGAPWARWADRIGYVGAIKGSEATHGAAGWHPHVHALFFLSSDPGEALRAEFLEWMRDRWSRKIDSFYWNSEKKAVECLPMNRPRPEGFASLFGRPHPDHGLRITTADKAGGYVAKMGLGREVSLMDVKGGRLSNRTPWQILAAWREHGTAADAALWREWCSVMKGRAHLVWSPGLRDRTAPLALDLWDEEIAGETPSKSKLVLDFERVSWWALNSAAKRQGQDFGSIVCDVLQEDDPEALIAVAQILVADAGMPGVVSYDPLHRYVWIEPPSRATALE